jgi:hypothetical protein
MARNCHINELDQDQLMGGVMGQCEKTDFAVLLLGQFRGDDLDVRVLSVGSGSNERSQRLADDVGLLLHTILQAYGEDDGEEEEGKEGQPEA